MEEKMRKRCEKCGRPALKIINILALWMTSLIGCATIGVIISFAIWNNDWIIAMEFGDNPLMVDLIYNLEVARNQAEMRPLAINLTRNCSDDECRLIRIYNYLNAKVDYVPVEKGRIYPSSEVVKYGAGDCKNMVIAFCSLMRSIGQNCHWSINKEYHHIVAVVKQNNQTTIVDLTANYLGTFNDASEYWKFIKVIKE